MNKEDLRDYCNEVYLMFLEEYERITDVYTDLEETSLKNELKLARHHIFETMYQMNKVKDIIDSVIGEEK